MQSRSQTRKIILWGLPNAGKTSFLLALLKGLRTFGAEMGWSYVLHSPDSSSQEDFQLLDLPNFLENFELPVTTKTTTTVVIDLKFRSKVMSNDRLHQLEIVDIAGNDIYDADRLLDIDSSDAVMCFLSKPEAGHSHIKAINALQKIAKKSNDTTPPKFAICLSRADQYLGFKIADQAFKENATSQDAKYREWLSEIIGTDILNALEQITEQNAKRHFMLSSIGWVKAPTGQMFPNLTSLVGRTSQFIYKPSAWKPCGVMEVFFWLLDEMDLPNDIYNINYEQLLRLYWARKQDQTA